MKMRFWQKTYILTLTVFLMCLNAGILLLTFYTHKRSVEAAEIAAQAEQAYVGRSFERDALMIMISGNTKGDSEALMKTYGTRYSAEGMLLAFYQEGKKLYSDIPDDITFKANSIKTAYIDGKRYLLVASSISSGSYELVMAKNVNYLDKEYHSMMLTFVMTAAIVSVVLAIILFFVLKSLSKPLLSLQKTTETIENGDFSARVPEKGNDEFTQLARSFNLMLRKIEEQMITLEKESEQKQRLVDNMAHELRTPLTSIRGYADFLEKAKATEERKHLAVQYIMSESERLQKISEILLDSAFIRENKAEMTELNGSGIIEDAVSKLKQKAENAGVTLSCHLSNLLITGNATLLSMMFYNIIDNAIKACEPDGHVAVACGDSYVTIEDDGKGMTAEQLQHITEPFYRTDKARSRADGGAGLGLSLCRQIAEIHKAKLVFDSDMGKGTKVTVDFG